MVKEEFNLLYQFCSVLHGGLWSPYGFLIYNIERKYGLRSMIFYDTKVIPECDSRHSFSCYFFRYPNLIRHHTRAWALLGLYYLFLCCNATIIYFCGVMILLFIFVPLWSRSLLYAYNWWIFMKPHVHVIIQKAS